MDVEKGLRSDMENMVEREKFFNECHEEAVSMMEGYRIDNLECMQQEKKFVCPSCGWEFLGDEWLGWMYHGDIEKRRINISFVAYRCPRCKSLSQHEATDEYIEGVIERVVIKKRMTYQSDKVGYLRVKRKAIGIAHIIGGGYASDLSPSSCLVDVDFAPGIVCVTWIDCEADELRNGPKSIEFDERYMKMNYRDIKRELEGALPSDTVTFTADKYNPKSNDFTATTSGKETIKFDPFVGCAIELTDEEYAAQDIAKSVVGHKFVVKTGADENNICPLPSEVIYTSWRDIRKK